MSFYDVDHMPEVGWPAGGFIYVLGFGTHQHDVRRIKVGRSINPDARIYQVRRQSQTGLPLAFRWVSPPHLDYRHNETRLLNWCAEQYPEDYYDWPGIGREWFDGLDPFAVIEHAQTLPMGNEPVSSLPRPYISKVLTSPGRGMRPRESA